PRPARDGWRQHCGSGAPLTPSSRGGWILPPPAGLGPRPSVSPERECASAFRTAEAVVTTPRPFGAGPTWATVPDPRSEADEGRVMAIDFEIPPEAKAIREKVRQWVHDECIPAEKELDAKPLPEVLDPLRKKARGQGLWCPFIPKDHGGMGLGPLANALVQMELGESS